MRETRQILKRQFPLAQSYEEDSVEVDFEGATLGDLLASPNPSLPTSPDNDTAAGKQLPPVTTTTTTKPPVMQASRSMPLVVAAPPALPSQPPPTHLAYQVQASDTAVVMSARSHSHYDDNPLGTPHSELFITPLASPIPEHMRPSFVPSLNLSIVTQPTPQQPTKPAMIAPPVDPAFITASEKKPAAATQVLPTGDEMAKKKSTTAATTMVAAPDNRSQPLVVGAVAAVMSQQQQQQHFAEREQLVQQLKGAQGTQKDAGAKDWKQAVETTDEQLKKNLQKLLPTTGDEQQKASRKVRLLSVSLSPLCLCISCVCPAAEDPTRCRAGRHGQGPGVCAAVGHRHQEGAVQDRLAGAPAAASAAAGDHGHGAVARVDGHID